MKKKSLLQQSVSLIALIALLMASSCKKDNPDPVPVLHFTAATISCQIGSPAACVNVATPSIPSGGAITYTSSNINVATVNASSGAITLVSGGTTTVTASQAALAGKNGAATASYTLTVTAPDPTPVLTLSTGPYICAVGSTTACTWVATSSIPSGGAISYSVTPTSIATINASTGAITAVAAGTATVTATQAASAGKNSTGMATYSIIITGLSITSFNPLFGGVGYTVTIAGTNFDGVNAANNMVTINGVATATPTNVSSTSLTVLVPKGASGTGNIEVKVGAQKASKGTFTEYATVTTLAGDGTQSLKDNTGLKAAFNTPAHMTLDASGNIYVADYGNSAVRKVTPDGVVTTIADNSNGFIAPWGITYSNSKGKLYVSDRSSNLISSITLSSNAVNFYAGSTYNGDGHNTGTNLTDVQFDRPQGLALNDAFGYLYLADRWFSLIRLINPAGLAGYVYELGGNSTSSYINAPNGPYSTSSGFYFPDGVALEPNGEFLLVADAANNAIRKVTVQGTVTTTTFAGSLPNGTSSGEGGSTDGTGTAARFYYPAGIAMDAAGNAYVCDNYNGGIGLIRKITPAGVVTTIAGATTDNVQYLDGLGPYARIYAPEGIAVAPDGSAIYVSDGTNRIRKIVP